jgi:hypothetical protein
MLEMNVEIINDEKFAIKRQCYFKKRGEVNQKTRQTLLRGGGIHNNHTKRERHHQYYNVSVLKTSVDNRLLNIIIEALK